MARSDVTAPIAEAPLRYRDARLETMEPHDLRGLEDRLLVEHLGYVSIASPFYQLKWAAARVAAGGIAGVNDLVRLPFTEKAELQESQAADPPFGRNVSVPLDRLIRMQATGGTTGRPLLMAMTRRDVEAYNEVGARAAWAAGLRPGDILLECMNYSLYAGGVNDHMTFETVGACVAPIGVGQSRRLLEILRGIGQPTALYSTPSYALHLASVARMAGLEPAGLGVRKGLFSGDAGLGVPSYREEIEQTWGLLARNIYGTGETAPLGAECELADGLHFLGQGAFVAELVEADSGETLGIDDGAVGELVVTTLTREAFPLVRFRTRDQIRVSDRPCGCGRTGFRFWVLGRTDDMFIVRGVNVFPIAVGEVIGGFRPAVSGEYEIVLDAPPPIDRPPRVRVELAAHLTEEEEASLRDRLTTRIRELLVFTLDVQLVALGALPRTELKARRLIRTYLGEGP